jgi:hypothetical protein
MIKKKVWAALASLACAVGLSTAATSPASAASPCAADLSVHCYTSIVYDNGGAGYSPQATRLNATMHWTCSTPASSGAWMTTGSLWGGNQDGGTTEMGLITPPTGLAGHPTYIPENYWVRYGGSYGTGVQLFYTNFFASRNVDYAMRMNWDGVRWVLTRDGTQIGALSSPTGPLKSSQAGFEVAVSNNNNDSGKVWNVQRVQNAVTYQGIGSGWTSSSAIVSAPPFINPPDILTSDTVQSHTTGAFVVPCQ